MLCLLVHPPRPPKSCLSVFHGCTVRHHVLSDCRLLGIKICLNSNSCFVLEEKKPASQILFFLLSLCKLDSDFLLLKIAEYKCLVKKIQLSSYEDQMPPGWRLCLEMLSPSHPTPFYPIPSLTDKPNPHPEVKSMHMTVFPCLALCDVFKQCKYLSWQFTKIFLRGNAEETVDVLQLLVSEVRARNFTSLFTVELPIKQIRIIPRMRKSN